MGLSQGSQYPSDAADSAPTDPIANRTTPDGFTGPQVVDSNDIVSGAAAVEDPAVDLTDALTQLMQVQSESDDTIVCTVWPAAGIPIVVAKPPHLQRTTYDGQTVDGKTYAYSSQTERTVTTDDEEYTETINEEYSPGVSLILAAQPIDGETNVDSASWIDLNLAARRFVREDELEDFDAVIKSLAADYMVCKELDEDGNEIGDTIYVMKPWILRVSPFDGQTVNGVTYDYSSNTERDATFGGDEETQVVTQDYYVGAKIVVGKKKYEEDAGGNATQYYDTNDSGRSWAVPLE